MSVATAIIVFAPDVSVTPQLKLSPFSVAGAPLQVTPAIPESRSTTVPTRVTDPVKKVDPLAGEVTLRTGGVLSSFTVALAVDVFPALSTTVPTTLWPVVSVVTITGAVQEVRGLLPGAQVKATVGLALCHPAAFGAGVTAAVIVGGTASDGLRLALNLEARLPASKYKRRPTALLCPPHIAPAAFVPILVSIFTDRRSVEPLNVAGENGVNAMVTSFALFAFLVTPVTQRVRPDESKTPFL